MLWLLTKIWLSLGGAALLGLLIGWAWRGLGLKSKMHRAEAERDLALADRDSLRSEVEALHTAQSRTSDGVRAAPAAAAAAPATNGPALQAELDRRDQRLKALTDELARSKEELEKLRALPKAEPAPAAAAAGLAAAAGAAAAAGMAGTRDLSADLAALRKERDELGWRNKYLETRIGVLEQAAAPPASDIPQEKADMIAELDRLRDENTRLSGELATVKRADPAGIRPGAPARDSEVEQELARLRWRNRYLESRLDYLEGRKDAEPAAVPSPAAPVPAEPPAVADVAPVAADPVPEALPADPVQPEPVPEPALALEPMPEPVPAAASELTPVEPPRLDAPRGGTPDDLQKINGIGPLIERALNAFGIFHYDQIAAWTPAEGAWIDSHLGFSGRVERDDWIGQAWAIVAGELAADDEARTGETTGLA